MNSRKHEVTLRLKAIELLAYWEGRLVTNRLITWFGISRQQASSDIKTYISDYNPDSLVHEPGVKAYVPKSSFCPVLTKGHINEYFDLISDLSGDSDSISFEQTDTHLAAIQLPDRTVRPEVVREILRACRSESSLKILYASMNNPIWTERTISPHTMVYTGFRWHTRAFCHTRGDFRDFILSRIDRTPKLSEEKYADPSQDLMWKEKVSISLVPNPKLNERQRSLVEKDFGMPDGRLQLSVKKALAQYTLQRYQAAITIDEAADEYKYPIVLLDADRKKLSPYIFGSDS